MIFPNGKLVNTSFQAQWNAALGTSSCQVGKGGYTLRVVREVRCIFSGHLKVSNVLDFLIAAGNSFQIVGAEKVKERLLILVVKEGIRESF